MTGGRRVEHVRFEHGVVGNTPNNNPVALVATDGAIGQDVDFELGVLADLQLVRVLQQRLQRQQHRVAIQLFRHAHVGMGQRNVGRFVGRDGKRQAHQLRMLGVAAIGLGDESDQRCLGKFVQPGLEALLGRGWFRISPRRRPACSSTTSTMSWPERLASRWFSSNQLLNSSRV